MPIQAIRNRQSEIRNGHIVYLGLGSNVGNRMNHIRQALALIKLAGIQILKTSRWYETKAVGVTRQRPFVNGVVRAKTSLEPVPLLNALKALERAMGRLPTKRWGPRVIDVDILLFDRRQVRTSRLTIPHPRLSERGFALLPLSELISLKRIPGLKMVHE